MSRPPAASDERALADLEADLPSRRWFPVKGVAAHLSLHAVLDLADPLGEADVRVLLVRARAGSIDALLQVPVVAAPEGGGPAVDAAAHPAFLRAWFAAADGPGGAPAAVDLTTAAPITGEQSNSSVVLGAAGDPGRAILKVLRALQPGENPDIDVPRHLVAQGWSGVPAPLAWVTAAWPDPLAPDEDPTTPRADVTGYLGVASAFVEGAQDGFELACRFAAEGASFDEHAHRLGVVTAQMHAALTRAFPVVADDDGPQRLADAVLGRFAWALAAVPSLERYRAGVERVAEQVRALGSTPARQRVHGDLHLGQVLHVHDDWLVLDFEGEPLAPLEARTRPDLAVRDVAGLLRSFDYAAAVGGATGEGALAWTASSRAALLAGYAQEAGSSHDEGGAHGDAVELVTRALELDKTLYEAVYESRNRPDWLPIPLAGLDRITS